MEKARRASHAGSWYTENPRKLSEELEGWLRESGLTKSPDVRGVIAPHAGYSYSGRAAAYAFGNIDPTNITRVFLLGPSHHYYTPKCALSTATVYKTPIGDLTIDLEVIEELKATGKFELMDIRVDEAEHSMEMHLPYLAKVFEGHQVKVVPILVGALKAESEAMYGQLLGKYVDDPQNFFSVSSDFCHWGSRFNYTHYDKKHGAIHKSIEALDRMGMDIIETGNPDAFKEYLLEFDNTICGRHPISVFLHMLKNCSTSIKINFLRYEQSSQCRTMRDSSVSYASAAAKVGATGKALKDVIAVGIGGSFLGHLQTAFGSIRWAKKSKSKTPREMQDNTAAVEEEKPSSSAKKLLNHWLRFSSVTLGEQRG